MNGRKPMLATLADLLAPISISEFLEVFHAKKRLHIRASDRTRAETLFSWHDIDVLLSRHALDGNIKILREGIIMPRSLYTSPEGKRLNVRALHDLLAQGVSVVVDSVERSIWQIDQLSAAIEREMGVPTYVNAYLTFFKGGAFKPHWDVMDVLVVQIHGSKRWRVWNTETAYPVEIDGCTKFDASVTPDQEIEMAAGDVLFIPRGEPHSAAVSTTHSVHLSIGLHGVTGIDFLDHLRKEAIKDSVLRMDLPRHSSDEKSRAHEAVLKKQLHKLIDAASMLQFLEEADLFRSPALQTAVAGQLPHMEDILRLTLRRRVSLPDVPPNREPQSVTIGGETHRLSPASIDVLRWLFDHDPATMRELHAGLSPPYGKGSIEPAIHELLRLGFLVVNRPNRGRLLPGFP